MRARIRAAAVAVALSFLATTVGAEEFFIYPSKGQSAEQQEKDKFECYQWAKQQTGFDPMARQETAPVSAEPATPEGGAVRGAARGAAVGAIAGAIAGDAGQGAAIGAGAGGAGGALRRRDAQRRGEAQRESAEQAAKDQYSKARGSWERAAKSCLTGRGYSIN